MSITTVSKISVKIPPVQNMFLFRSTHQTWTAAGAVVGLLAILSLASILISPNDPGFKGAMIGAALGSLVGTVAVLSNSFHATFRWTFAKPEDSQRAIALLRDRLRLLGYSVEQTPDSFYKTSDLSLPTSNDFIRINKNSADILVSGPWAPLRKLRRHALSASLS